MNDAIWLLLAVPEWYAESIADPLGAGPLTLIPACGLVCLAAGIVLAVRQRSRASLLFLIPLLLSEAFVAAAGALRGQVSSPTFILLAFLGVQFVLSAGLAVRLSGARAAGLLLGFFSLSYALFAAFVAAMAFTDSWV